jgi:hypothetical protein
MEKRDEERRSVLTGKKVRPIDFQGEFVTFLFAISLLYRSSKKDKGDHARDANRIYCNSSTFE